jgi:hypothetical protein
MIIHTLRVPFFSRIIRTDYFGISELRRRARRLLGKVSRCLLVVQQSVGHNFQSAAGREFGAESAGIRRNVRPLQGKQSIRWQLKVALELGSTSRPLLPGSGNLIKRRLRIRETPRDTLQNDRRAVGKTSSVIDVIARRSLLKVSRKFHGYQKQND